MKARQGTQQLVLVVLLIGSCLVVLTGTVQARQLLTRQGRLRADDRMQRGALPHDHMERAGTHTLFMRTPKAVAGEEIAPAASRQLLTRQGRLRPQERAYRDAIPHAHMERAGMQSVSMRTPKALAVEKTVPAASRQLLTRQGRLRADDRMQRGALPHDHMARAGMQSVSMRTPKAVAGEEVPAAGRQLLTRQGRLRPQERAYRDAIPHAHMERAGMQSMSMRTPKALAVEETVSAASRQLLTRQGRLRADDRMQRGALPHDHMARAGTRG